MGQMRCKLLVILAGCAGLGPLCDPRADSSTAAYLADTPPCPEPATPSGFSMFVISFQIASLPKGSSNSTVNTMRPNSCFLFHPRRDKSYPL